VNEIGSTAELAKQLDAPVLLVIDGSAMARSAAAMVAGYAKFDPAL
jgi:cobyrinic acid a,c-diamide synthase